MLLKEYINEIYLRDSVNNIIKICKEDCYHGYNGFNYVTTEGKLIADDWLGSAETKFIKYAKVGKLFHERISQYLNIIF